MNSTWQVLANKALATTRDAQAAVNEARQRVEKIEASMAHVDRLRDDYMARYAATQQQAHSIQDTITYRKFLEHLRGLRRKVEVQLEEARLQFAHAAGAMVEAQREQAKMEAMVEREQRNRALLAAQAEQRALDEAGLRLYNQR